MHSLFGIYFVLYLLKLLSRKGLFLCVSRNDFECCKSQRFPLRHQPWRRRNGLGVELLGIESFLEILSSLCLSISLCLLEKLFVVATMHGCFGRSLFWSHPLTLSQPGPINVERARSMARSMTSPIHIFGLVHAM